MESVMSHAQIGIGEYNTLRKHSYNYEQLSLQLGGFFKSLGYTMNMQSVYLSSFDDDLFLNRVHCYVYEWKEDEKGNFTHGAVLFEGHPILCLDWVFKRILEKTAQEEKTQYFEVNDDEVKP